MEPPIVVGALVLSLTVLYIIFWSVHQTPRHRRHQHPCSRYRRGMNDPDAFVSGQSSSRTNMGITPEGYTAGSEAPSTNTVAASPPSQTDIDFSDISVSQGMLASTQQTEMDASLIQTVNDRFRAAKRTVAENKLKNGVYTNKERRKLVETLLRRAGGACGRRVRAWRTENSDFLRGDIRPKQNTTNTNIVRSAKNNPDIDLHPGALGPMAGLEGRWLMEENIPGNLFDDAELVYG